MDMTFIEYLKDKEVREAMDAMFNADRYFIESHKALNKGTADEINASLPNSRSISVSRVKWITSGY